MSSSERIAELSSWVDTTAARVRETATSSPRGGDERWQAVLAELGVEPLAASERARHISQGPPSSRGALVMEFRWAMEAITRQAEPRCRDIDMSLGTDEDDAQRAVDKLARRLGLMVDEELARYVSAIRPTVTTSSIFANAMATSPNHTAHAEAAGYGAGVSTTACGACGAPRLSGRTEMTCEFCGSQIT